MKQQQWLKKIHRAQYVEKQILRWIRKNYDEDAKLMDGYFPEYDIESKKLGNVEIKEDRMAHQTGNYAFEFENYSGQPSGYLGTEAAFFVIVDWEYVTLIPTESLRFVINSREKKTVISMGEKEHPVKGYLIPRDAILTSPFAQVIKRWFPVIGKYD